MAFLSRFCNGELFVNTRLSVKVKLSVFNLVKATQSCREEVKISSKNVKFLKATLVLTYCYCAFKTNSRVITNTLIQCFSNSYRDKQGRRGVGGYEVFLKLRVVYAKL